MAASPIPYAVVENVVINKPRPNHRVSIRGGAHPQIIEVV
jgi:hypothetical protein